MDWIQNLFSGLSTPAAVLALIIVIGGSVIFLRALIRLALRTLVIGTVGLVVLGVLYFLINNTSLL